MSDNPYKDQVNRYKQINKKLEDCQQLMQVMGTVYLDCEEFELSETVAIYFDTLGEFIVSWQSFINIMQGFIKPSEIPVSVLDNNIVEVKQE